MTKRNAGQAYRGVARHARPTQEIPDLRSTEAGENYASVASKVRSRRPATFIHSPWPKESWQRYVHDLEAGLRTRLAATETLLRTARENCPPILEVEDPYRPRIDEHGRAGATVGSDHAIADSNDRFAALVGATGVDLLGRSFRTLVFPDDRAAWDELLEDALEKGAAGGVIRLSRPVSGSLPVHVALAPFGRSNVAYSAMATRLDAPRPAAEARSAMRLWREILEQVRSGGGD
jgi:PAS domain S-box-containing protein